MSKLLVMTDLHITPSNQPIAGLDSYARCARGLQHAAYHHPDAERLVIMGDLTHGGTVEEYERLAELLVDLPWPVSLMMGNHDHRETFQKHFPDTAADPNGFVQSAIDMEDVRLITLDSLADDQPVKHAGLLCEKRMAFLKQSLSESNKPCLVFIHHPPFDTGFSGMDQIGLLNAAELRRALTDSSCIHTFAGHIHRTITASIDGLTFTTFKSTCHQMPMLLGQNGSGHSVDEPGAYGILLTGDEGVVVHFEDFTLPNQAATADPQSS